MELTPMHKRVIALDVDQAMIAACAVVEHDDGRVEVTKRDFGAFKRDRRALAQWSLEIRPPQVRHHPPLFLPIHVLKAASDQASRCD